MQVVVNGLLTQYERIGSGKSVVILHGWADSLKGWQPFAQKLAANGYEVVVCDLPGFGATQKPKSAWDLTDYAQFVQAFVNKIGITSYAFIGHSHGGAIAIRGVGRGILQTERLVLLASAGVRGEDISAGLVAITKLGKVLSAPLPTSWQNKLRASLYAKVGSDMLVAEHMQDTFKRIVADDVRDDATKINVSTLLMYGSEDTATPVKYARLMNNAIEGSKLYVLPEVGHFIHNDAEGVVLAEVKEFLR